MQDRNSKTLGMDRPIARRDVLAGGMLALAGATALPGLATAQPGAPAGAAAPAHYPPALTGLRGQHEGSFEAAHQVRDGALPAAAVEDTLETYDLVVVGAGISGLSAAYFFRQQMGPDARVLILDNHDDFGGHAKRNEFRHEGRLYIGYGGTMSIETPYHPYSYTARTLIRDLGIDVASYRAHLNNKVYEGLGSGVFFDKEHFGVDRLVVGQGQKPWPVFFRQAPFSARARADLVRLHEAKTDYMPGLDPKAKAEALKRISYQRFLTDHAQVGAEALKFFAGNGWRNNMRLDTCPAYTAAKSGAPGFAGMAIDGEPRFESSYYFHFPDGNATVARLLVNRLVPDALPGSLNAETVATAVVDYSRLDGGGQPVRIRLNSTVVHAEHEGDPTSARSVAVTYVQAGRLRRVRGANVVMACFNNIVGYIVPGLPPAQREALSYGSKVPLLYTNVFLRNWRAFKKLGIQRVSAPFGYHTNFGLDFPVSMDGYPCPGDPDQPIVVHMGRNPNAPGLSRKDQNRAGRADILATPFSTIEREIRSQMARTLGAGGFDPARDILAITVNRWPHGYAYTYDSLGDPDLPEHERPHVLGRRPFGRIAIANSDSAASAFTHDAIDQAQRAVQDVLRSRGMA